MAYLLNTSCWICGTEHQGLVFGSGFIERTPFVPAIERATNKLACVAIGDDEHYRYYTDKSMYELSEDEELLHWGELWLSPVNNYCPECQEYSMDFIPVGESD